MPKMRNSDAPTVLNDYLYCNSKSNKPRISHRVCEERCKKFKNCHDYNEWYFNYYGKELEKPKPKRKKVVRRKKKKIKKRKPKAKVVKA